MKKFISIFLIVVLTLAFSSSLVFAEDSSEYSPDSIIVNYGGKLFLLDVFYNDEQIYVPANVLSRFGGMKKRIDGYETIYYYPSQQNSEEFIKEIRIVNGKNSTYGELWIFRYANGLGNIVSTTQFSDKYEDENGDLFLPIAELLPFLRRLLESV